MPLISNVDRKSKQARLIIWSMYILLLLGSVTMVYPFLIMLSGSTASSVDTPDISVVPKFLYEDETLERKAAESLFNESIMHMRATWQVGGGSFRDFEIPRTNNRKLVQYWENFLNKKSPDKSAWTLCFVECPSSKNVQPENLRRFRELMRKKFDNDLGQMNFALGTKFTEWAKFRVKPEYFSQRRARPVSSKFYDEYRAFAESRPLPERYYLSIDRFYVYEYLQNRYGRDIEKYNKLHSTSYSSWDNVHLFRRVYGTTLEREDWEIFVRELLSLYWIRIDEGGAAGFRNYLKAKRKNIGNINSLYGTDFMHFSDINLYKKIPVAGIKSADWESYIKGWRDPQSGKIHKAALEDIFLVGTDFYFQDYLQNQYGSLDKFRLETNTTYNSWADVLPPQAEWHLQKLRKRKSGLRWEFVKRNYIVVLDTLALHGNALRNTVVYCALAILTSLTVNPLAAYALSRYRPPSAYKVLLYLMLTMAFPPMVTQIPTFLMLREFNLLNTFWALILPGMANGYSIFLLKGFFDSLPQELYESAMLDGAGEFRIFWQITMTLSKPILAVIALNTFTKAYSNFMMALLICQDSDMWTIMPWLYQLQNASSQGIVYASMIIAAIPSFLVFAFCQKVIMRGIVVPVEK